MAAFDQVLAAALKDGTLPGVILGATNATGSFQYLKAADAQGEDITTARFETESPVRLHSCSKLITSVALLQCIERGLIGLNDDVANKCPELQLAGKKVLLKCDPEDPSKDVFEDIKTPITPRLLVTHSAGLASGFLEPEVQKYRIRDGSMQKFPTMLNIPDKYFAVPLAYQPDTSFAYSSGHDYAGLVVQSLTGLSLEDYFHEHICKPLGLGPSTMTFFPERDPDGVLNKIPLTWGRGEYADNIAKIIADGNPDEDKAVSPILKFPSVTAEDCGGGSGLTATVPAYLKVMHSLLANDERLLKKQTVELLFTPQQSPAAAKTITEAIDDGVMGKIAPGEFPTGGHVWSLGGMLNNQAAPGWRSKHTLIWSGYTNLLWFIDREADLCGIFATQLLPTGDKRTASVITAWEKEMHRLAAEAMAK